MIDFHSHILPNIDDGSTSMDETINLIIEAKQVGFTDIIATPHYIQGYYEYKNYERKQLLVEVEKNYKQIVEGQKKNRPPIAVGQKKNRPQFALLYNAILFSNNLFKHLQNLISQINSTTRL